MMSLRGLVRRGKESTWIEIHMTSYHNVMQTMATYERA